MSHSSISILTMSHVIDIPLFTYWIDCQRIHFNTTKKVSLLSPEHILVDREAFIEPHI